MSHLQIYALLQSTVAFIGLLFSFWVLAQNVGDWNRSKKELRAETKRLIDCGALKQGQHCSKTLIAWEQMVREGFIAFCQFLLMIHGLLSWYTMSLISPPALAVTQNLGFANRSLLVTLSSLLLVKSVFLVTMREVQQERDAQEQEYATR